MTFWTWARAFDVVSPSLPQVCGAAAGSGDESSVGPVLEEQSPELLRGRGGSLESRWNSGLCSAAQAGTGAGTWPGGREVSR